MLELKQLSAAIEGIPVLRNVDMSIEAGSTIAIIGRNGAGKTSLLRSIMGFMPSRGEIRFDGADLLSLPTHQRPALGIGYAPEDRRLYASFTLEENICLPGEALGFPAARIRSRLDEIYQILPELKDLRMRLAAGLSGGQGKMVALGRALMVGSKLVLLDEPFQGLAPALALRYATALRTLRNSSTDTALVITESNPSLLREFAQTTYQIERGEVSQKDMQQIRH